MTGPEHYREAERISAAITHRGNLDEGDHRDVLMLAQLHATLALAAATALNDAEGGMSGPDWGAWRDVASEPLQTPVTEATS